MWLFSRIGFFSIVNKSGAYHVRARRRADLKTLTRTAGIAARIINTPDADYPARLILGHDELGRVMNAIGETVDYDDFKSAITGIADQGDKIDYYYRVWIAMRMYQESLRPE